MIVVDSSVWIAHFRGVENLATRVLRNKEVQSDIVVGDVVLLELLQGARDEQHAGKIEENLRRFEIRTMIDEHSPATIARNYRVLRDCGVTVRKTMDMIIATFCIEGGHHLLHIDRDFDNIAKHLPLQIYDIGAH
jgi:predicted nucleic acid-binding protein